MNAPTGSDKSDKTAKLYPLVMADIAMENGPFILDLPIKMVIFHSYVSLPEGKWVQRVGFFGPRPDGTFDGFGCDMPKDVCACIPLQRWKRPTQTQPFWRGKEHASI